jgi:5,10-methylenetetrahydromethanopterin reductase
LKFGLALWPDRGLRELAALARKAEDVGFDDLWWPDHYDAREVASVLSQCATATDRIRIGTAVTSPLLRHPAVLASMFATLDELSGGRVLAGLGPGGFEVGTTLHVEAQSPLSAIRESVRIIRGLTGGETVTMEGSDLFPVTGARLGFRSDGPIPVYLAGRGRNMIHLAGEIADGVITHGLASTYLGVVADQVTSGLVSANRMGGGCRIALMLEVSIDHDLDRGRDALRPRCLYMVGGEYSEDLIPLYGLEPGAVKPIRAAVRAGDPGAVAMIDDRMVDAFALTGPASVVAERLASLEGLGVGSVILSPGKQVSAAGIDDLGSVIKEVRG